MLGIIIGIAAVIAMVALGEGAQRSVQARLAGLGANVLTVRPGQGFSGGIGRGQARLTTEDAEALAAAEGLRDAVVVPEMEGRLQVESGAANANLSVVGTWPAYFAVQNFALAEGRLLGEGDERARRRVAVLGALAGDALGAGPSRGLLGATIRVGGVSFEVVGVLAEKGSQGFSNPDETIYLPLSTARLRASSAPTACAPSRCSRRARRRSRRRWRRSTA